MSTSLAEQLQRLAVPQTSNLRRDKKRASLLFDPKEAAALSKETVYQIGLDGFNELRQKNPIFNQFETTLFHVTSKEFERAVQTADANEKLANNINRFLHLLSPYFLLNCSHKCLEWLIHRYYIHEYDRDNLIMLILPYHETNIFVRALQIIKIKDNDRWLWLKPLQKPGVHLTKKTLFNHAASNPFFIQFVSKYLLAAIKTHEKPSYLTVLFGFYCTTFTGALEYSTDINESIVSQMLPSIIKGLKSDISDYCASSYIIVSKLLSKTKVSDKLLDKLVERIALVNISSLRLEAVLTMVVLYQSQKEYVDLPEDVVNHWAECGWVPSTCNELLKRGYAVDVLLLPLLKCSLRMAMEEVASDKCRKFVDSMLAEMKLDENILRHLMTSIINLYDLDLTYPEETLSWMKSIMDYIEKHSPDTFDDEIRTIIKSKNQRIIFQKIVQSKNIENRCDLFEKLYHPSPELRLIAVEGLLKDYSGLKIREQDFIKNALIDRLNDEDLHVVKQTLSLSQDILIGIMDNTKIKPILLSILSRSRNMNESELSCAVLNLLTKIDFDEDVEVLLAVLPFLLPVNQGDLQAVQIITKSSFFSNHALFRDIQSVIRDTSVSNIFDKVYKGIISSKLDINVLISGIKNVSNFNTLQKYLIIVLLSASIPKEASNEIVLEVIAIILNYVKNSKTKSIKDGFSEIDAITFAMQDKLPLQGVLLCIEKLILKCAKPPISLGKIDFCKTDYHFHLELLEFLLKGAYSPKVSTYYSATLKVYFDYFCENLKLKIEYFLNIVTADSTNISILLKLMSIKTVNAIMYDNPEVDVNFVDYKCVIVPYLLNSISCDDSDIRVTAMETVKTLLNRVKVTTENFTFLLNEIVESTQEILMDKEQLPLVVFNILNGKGLKAQGKTLIQNLLSNYEKNYPIYLKSGLIKMLSLCNQFEVYPKTAAFVCKVLEDQRELREFNKQYSDIITVCISQFDEFLAADLKMNTEIWSFIQLALNDDKSVIKDNETLTCPSILLMNKIGREIFNCFPDDIQVAVLNLIVKMATNSTNNELASAAARLFKHIDLDACSIIEQLVEMRDVQSPKIVERRKRRVSVVPTLDILDTNQWKRGVTILEFIQSKKKIRNIEKLIPTLFEILKKCLDFDEQASVEYPKQLILSNILHYCDKLDEVNIPENVFNMELVVQCIRASQNPQTHHHALLLLARVATFIPSQVLHHMMAIFTFMGSSVLRHDDAYSFQIITKIIETIIPILVKDGSKETIVKVLRVFVDVILDVPEHRRMPLYCKLLNQVGTEDNLYIFLLLIFESHVLNTNTDKQKNANGLKKIDVASNLCIEFPPNIVISSCIKLVEYLKTLPEDKEEMMDTDSDDLFNISQHTSKQFRHYKYTLVTFTCSLLSSKEFVNQIAELTEDDCMQLETLFKNMIINVLSYIQNTSKVAERSANTPQAQYWKVMLHHSYDILDSLNALLTPQMFLLVIKALMTHNISNVKRRAMELINSKIQHNSDFFNECDQNELFALLPPIINIIKSVEKGNLSTDEEIIIQTALLSLKLFVKLLALNQPDKFTQIIHFITDLVKLNKINTNILASALLCLSELCTNLRAHAIPYLNKFMPAIIKVLKSQKNEDTPSLLLLSAITALQKIFDCLPLFLSPYLEKLLVELSNIACKWNIDSSDSKISTFVVKLQAIKQKIGATIPPRVLIPVIDTTYTTLISKTKYKSIAPLMDILCECVSNMPPPEIQHNITELTTLFINALQFRSEALADFDETNEIESHVIKALVNLVLKLSETNFRPLYYKLYDWAVRSESTPERVITFYCLSHQIANCLKGLYVLFASHVITNAASLIDVCNKNKTENLYCDSDQKTALLLESVLKTVSYICMYDTQKFINKERFDLLMQPIVDQLDNNLGDNYESRVNELIIPCIVNFAVATADDALWKQLNYQVLIKMRDTNPGIRLIALECLKQVARKLGEDFLPLLPETIPFLAELLEDEEETVEKACQKTVQELEKVLGEPLQKYF